MHPDVGSCLRNIAECYQAHINEDKEESITTESFVKKLEVRSAKKQDVDKQVKERKCLLGVLTFVVCAAIK